ncbi:alpha/beta hydrolase family protein [Sphingomonas crusticola]|uniref:alpha/beta hydrolase family protein n=1 Tax=Sphingomonas crusticola TaxID=1697973 RepID=UPI0019688922|nr:hypothetical protein [Sphingomonas crusticola]
MRSFLRVGSGMVAFLACTIAAAGPTVTADEERQEMMRQLGITALVAGASGDETAPNAANYDEAKANPYSALPDPLTLKNGHKVGDAKTWWDKRRPEILEDYTREVYGRVPAGLPAVQWRVTATDREMIGFSTPVIARRVIGHVENPTDPSKSVDIRLMEVLPANASAPVPVLIMFKYGPDAFPEPSQPAAAEYDRINAAIKALLIRQDPGLAAVFDAHQAFTFAAPPGFHLPQRDAKGDLPPADQLIAAGWGYVTLDPTTIQADNGAGLRSGIIGLANRGGPRKPDDWGALRAWAWGASRVLDWLATDPAVDAHRVGIEGVSRYGKAALVTMAFDQRFAVGLIGSSGKGGATLLRRNFGEGVANLATGSYYWEAGNFLKYNTKGVSKPGLDADDLPVDSNSLIALAAPRPLFISYGVPEAGDAKWLDQKGSFLAAADAGRVYRLLGATGVGTSGPVSMPPPENLIDGQLAWRQHTGGHTDAPNFRYFIPWANRQLGRPK